MFCLLSIYAISFCSVSSIRRLAIVRESAGGIILLPDLVADAIVTAELKDMNSKNGYYQFQAAASTKESDSDEERAYYMGYAEGYLLAPQIQDHMRNVVQDMFSELYDGAWPQKLREYVIESRKRIAHNYNAHGLEPFWIATYLIGDRYISGLYAGYTRYSIDNHDLGLMKISEDEFYMLSSIGDWELGLELLLYGDNETVVASIERRREEERFSHCSGCVRISDNLDSLFTGHATWTSWGFGFLRVMKFLNFNFKTLNTTSQQISYSSYPGFASSVDDFYLVKSQDKVTMDSIKIAVIETSYNIMNLTSAFLALSAVKETSTLTWVRAMVANLISASASNWPAVFTTNISYTYNDNWLIADYALLDKLNLECSTRGDRDNYIKTKSPALLLSLEVVPGYYKVLDVTKKLVHDGLYVSINVPADPIVRKRGDFTDDDPYEGSARYSIFMREGVQVESCKTMMDLMRYNNYKTDSASAKDPGNSIAARYDLRTLQECQRNPTPFGATDAKVITNYNFDDMSFWGLFGPTLGTNNDLPKFSFSSWPDLPHRGVAFTTLPVTTLPSLISPATTLSDTQHPFVTTTIIIMFVGILAVALIIAIKVTIYRRRKQIRNACLKKIATKDENVPIDLDELELNVSPSSPQSDTNKNKS